MLPIQRIGEVLAKATSEEWLIDRLWLAEGAGIIGGQPKLWKSWLGLDMAISVASGTNCLGRFTVKGAGPTLVFMAEDKNHEVRKRVERICESRGLNIRDLDLTLIKSPCLYLDNETDRDQLRRTIEHIHPKMLLLDPLVRIHRGDENNSHDIATLLGFLRELQRQYQCAVVLAHHANKRSHSRPGQGLRGSSDLHAFGDSNLYLSRHNDTVEITVEHRAAATTGPYFIQLVDEGGTHLQVVEPSTGITLGPPLGDRILGHLELAARPVARADLRIALRVNNHRLGKELTALIANRQVTSTADGICLA